MAFKVRGVGLALLVLAIFILIAGAAQAADVSLRLSWVNKNLSGKMQVYEMKDGKVARLWDTGTKKQFADLGAGAEITDALISVARGGAKKFLLVYHNETDKTVYFFAAPHSVDPAENALGFKFKCLCVNHAFSAGPGEYWYRVVEARISKDFVGDALTITHSLIATDKARMDKTDATHSMPEM